MIPALTPADLAIEAARRFAESGLLPPWDLVAPLTPLLLSMAPAAWIDAEATYWIVIFAGRVVGMAGLAALLGNPSGRRIGSLAYLLSPVVWWALWTGAPPADLMFWSMALGWCAVAQNLRRTRAMARFAGLLMLTPALCLTLPTALITPPALEFGCAMALVVARKSMPRRLWAPVVAGLAATFALYLAPDVRREPSPAPMLLALTGGWSYQTLGGHDLEFRESPLLRAARAWLLEPGGRPAEARWLRAMGVGRIVKPRRGDSHPALECVDRVGEWCSWQIPTAAPPAVLVSRDRFAALPPIRGLLDVEALDAYLLWASRPEAVGLRRGEAGSLVIEAHAGPGDLILVRTPARPGLVVMRHRDGRSQTVEYQIDPVGFLVLNPGRAGPVEFSIQAAGPRLERWMPSFRDPDLLDGPFPVIAAGSVVDAKTFQPGSFAAGSYATLFGDRFDLGGAHLLLDERRIEPSYVAANQINFQLPPDAEVGPASLRVVAGDRSSLTEPIEITPGAQR